VQKIIIHRERKLAQSATTNSKKTTHKFYILQHAEEKNWKNYWLGSIKYL